MPGACKNFRACEKQTSKRLFKKLGVDFGGCPYHKRIALLIGVYVRAPDFWKLPNGVLGWSKAGLALAYFKKGTFKICCL